jgi:formamidopyrimidine-DNA glycosylase
MPELPEVETVANGVHERVHGQRIESVWTSGKPQTFKSPESEIEAVLTGARIERVRRVGKTIVMTVVRKSVPPHLSDDGAVTEMGHPESLDRAEFLIHLGMTGRLLVSAAGGGTASAYACGAVAERRERAAVCGCAAVWAAVGGTAEAYDGPGGAADDLARMSLWRCSRGGRLAIKAALLNQSLLHGVGNIYADESLFRAGIRPRRQAGQADAGRSCCGCAKALIEVLKHAIKLGGSSVSDYVDADGVRGFFQLEHKVYGRAGKRAWTAGRG